MSSTLFKSLIRRRPQSESTNQRTVWAGLRAWWLGDCDSPHGTVHQRSGVEGYYLLYLIESRIGGIGIILIKTHHSSAL